MGNERLKVGKKNLGLGFFFQTFFTLQSALKQELFFFLEKDSKTQPWTSTFIRSLQLRIFYDSVISEELSCTTNGIRAGFMDSLGHLLSQNSPVWGRMGLFWWQLTTFITGLSVRFTESKNILSWKRPPWIMESNSRPCTRQSQKSHQDEHLSL